MAQTVKLKRSATPSAIPTTGQLELGEVAINTYDGKLYIKKDNGTASVVEIGAGGGGGDLDSVTDAGATTTNAITIGGLTVDGKVNEQQYALTGTVIDPANGTIQYKTLSANTTFTESLSDGDYVTLMIDDGSDYTVTWPTIYWPNGVAPTLAATGYSVIQLWQVNGIVYGAFVSA